MRLRLNIDFGAANGEHVHRESTSSSPCPERRVVHVAQRKRRVFHGVAALKDGTPCAVLNHHRYYGFTS